MVQEIYVSPCLRSFALLLSRTAVLFDGHSGYLGEGANRMNSMVDFVDPVEMDTCYFLPLVYLRMSITYGASNTVSFSVLSSIGVDVYRRTGYFETNSIARIFYRIGNL